MKCTTPEWHQQLTSTNSVLIERVRSGAALPDGFVLAAREQTAGRGRSDRRWVSQAGRDLTFSFLLRGPIDFPHIASLPMASVLGVAEALEALGLAVHTKWPNDLLVERRKICGVLAESCAADTVVVGIGLNVNMRREEADSIGRPVTSIAMETGEEYDVQETLGFVLPPIERWISRWRARGFFGLRAAWIQRCANVGEYVEVGDGEERRTGVVVGFGEAGQMLLREDDGRQSEVWVGDVAS